MVDSIGVHEHHCCKLHGCKYGEEDCPVVGDVVKQKYPCEDCNQPSGFGEYTNEEVTAMIKRYEFLANHVSYMQINLGWGRRDKLYPESCGVEIFNAIVDESIKSSKTEDEE